MSQHDDNASGQETDALLQSLQSRASSAPVKQDDSPPEDIDAFLADLERDASSAPAAAPASASAAAAPDPFADAFAALEDEHAAAVEAELSQRPVAPAPRAEPVKKAAPPVAVAAPPKKADRLEELAAPAPAAPLEKVPTPTPTPEKDDPKEKKKKASKEKDQIKVVETERSPGFRFTLSLIKWSAILIPVAFATWLLGAYFSAWISTGWLIALIALSLALVLPLVLRTMARRGAWWMWATPLSLLLVAALFGLGPRAAAERIGYYGHWPTATVAQLAGWEPDSAVVRSNAYLSEAFGGLVLGVEGVAPDLPPEHELLARALGTDTELIAWAEAKRAAANLGTPPAPAQPAPDGATPVVAPAQPGAQPVAPTPPAAQPAVQPTQPAVPPAQPDVTPPPAAVVPAPAVQPAPTQPVPTPDPSAAAQPAPAQPAAQPAVPSTPPPAATPPAQPATPPAEQPVPTQPTTP